MDSESYPIDDMYLFTIQDTRSKSLKSARRYIKPYKSRESKNSQLISGYR